MSDTDTIFTHGFDNPRAKAYFAEFIEDATLDFLEDTFEYDTDDLGETSDALIAAEIVAGLIGSPAAGLPADVRSACCWQPLSERECQALAPMAPRRLRVHLLPILRRHEKPG